MSTIDEHPKLMRLFFGTLAAELSERVNTSAAVLRKTARSLTSLNAAESQEASPVRVRDRSALQLARDFRIALPAEDPDGFDEAEHVALLASSECVVTLEQNALLLWEECDARLFVLNSHLCIESARWIYPSPAFRRRSASRPRLLTIPLSSPPPPSPPPKP